MIDFNQNHRRDRPRDSQSCRNEEMILLADLEETLVVGLVDVVDPSTRRPQVSRKYRSRLVVQHLQLVRTSSV